jgi:hypothetical protein
MPQVRWSRQVGICILLGAIFATVNLTWVLLNQAPPHWDDAWYLTNSLTVYDALKRGGIVGYLTKLNSVFGVKAPLIAALPAPFYLLFGRQWHAAYLVNIASMPMLFAAIYRIAERWWSGRAAIFAIAITGAMPLLYGLARWYMVEYAMTALVAAAICVLIESDGLTRDRYALLFGALCGFGLLLKISFPIFVLPPFIYVWLKSKRPWRPLMLAALPCFVLALPWYAGHFKRTLLFALEAGFGEVGIQGIPRTLSIRAIAAYLSHVATNGISLYFLCLLVLSGVWVASRRQDVPLRSDLSSKAHAPLLLTWLIPLAVFIFGNEDIRYVAPILPALALGVAFLLDFSLPRTRAGATAGALLLAFPMLQMFSTSFGVPYFTRGGGYAHRFSRKPWPQDEILKLIAAHHSLKTGGRDHLLVGADEAALNADNVELAAVASQLPIDVETTAHEKDIDTLRQRLASSSYFLFKEGGYPESLVFNPYIGDLVRIVTTDSHFRQIPYSRPLPDGGMARIYQNLAPGHSAIEAAFVKNGSRAGEEFAIDFGETLVLTGFSAKATPDETEVRFRWRCLKPPDREYWCFTHLIDPAGRIVAQNDHRLLGGEPPLKSWRPGDVGREEIRIRVPKGANSAGLRLRFGLYDPPSGERLHIGPLQAADSLRFSLSDNASSLIAPNR